MFAKIHKITILLNRLKQLNCSHLFLKSSDPINNLYVILMRLLGHKKSRTIRQYLKA